MLPELELLRKQREFLLASAARTIFVPLRDRNELAEVELRIKRLESAGQEEPSK